MIVASTQTSVSEPVTIRPSACSARRCCSRKGSNFCSCTAVGFHSYLSAWGQAVGFSCAIAGIPTNRDPDGTDLPDDPARRKYAMRVIRELQHGEEHNWSGWKMEVTQGSTPCMATPLRR